MISLVWFCLQGVMIGIPTKPHEKGWNSTKGPHPFFTSYPNLGSVALDCPNKRNEIMLCAVGSL